MTHINDNISRFLVTKYQFLVFVAVNLIIFDFHPVIPLKRQSFNLIYDDFAYFILHRYKNLVN